MIGITTMRSVGSRALTVGLLVATLLVLSLLAARPAHADTFIVNETADFGNGVCSAAGCTLREAINASNASTATNDTIHFAIPTNTLGCNATTGVCTITPTAQLPSITDTATIDGYTQTGASENNEDDNTNNAVLKIELNGKPASDAAAGGGTIIPGLTVIGSGANGTVIRGLVINRYSLHGVVIDAGATATVEGNFIGTNPTGETDLGNGFDGVLATSSNNRIGGAANEAQNIISGNGRDGVSLAGTGATANVIINNHIGTDADAIDPLGNTRHGVAVFSADSIVGGNDKNSANGAGDDDGTAQGEGNIISGNGGHGVLVDNIFAEGTKIQGNHIGVDRNGSGNDLANTLDGVRVSSVPQVEIGGTTDGLGNTISNNGQHGVEIVGTSSTFVKVQGNRIGTNYIGRSDLGNGGDGVRLGNVSNTTIGDATAAAARNLISGNGANGVFISGTSSATDNKVEGNFIGTNVDGAAGIANVGAGVRVETPGNVVGGTVEGARNVISGNAEAGVSILGAGATNNRVQGNRIGIRANSTTPLPNLHGVFISDAKDNTVGGTVAAASNTISGNTNQGVQVIGANATGNGVLRNSITANGRLAIELQDDGPTANDVRDPDAGPNDLQNFPVITSVAVSGGSTSIEGRLDSTPNTTFTIQLFANDAPNIPTGFGEAQRFLGQTSVTTNLSGDASFTFVSGGVAEGEFVTATATNPAGSTSELSFGVAARAPLIVNSTGDTGDALIADTPSVCDADLNTPGLQCTLRAAIQEANSDFGGADTINFAIPGGTGVRTISPASPLPAITQPLTIDGYSQPGTRQNTLAKGTDANLRIQLNGANAGASNGLNVTASGGVIRGMVINRFARGIRLAGSNNRVEGNFIGVNATATADLGNSQQGVIVAGSDDNAVGGIEREARNVISGNGNAGVSVNAGSTGNSIEGNLIGTNRDGTGNLGNSGAGVFVSGASDNTVGGATAGTANTIFFNGGDGVTVKDATASSAANNRVLRNSIFSNGGLGIDLDNDGPTANDTKDPDAGPNTLQNKPVLSSATTTAIQGSLNSTPGRTFTIQFFRNPSGDEGRVFIGQMNVTTNANGNATFSFGPTTAVPVGQQITATATRAGNTSEFSAPRAVAR